METSVGTRVTGDRLQEGGSSRVVVERYGR